MQLFIDESGAGKSFKPGSGTTFVLASNNLSEDDANLIKRTFFSTEKELKYGDLKGNQEISKFIKYLVEKNHSFLFYSINKPYILLVILIDIWIGQGSGRRNVDFYRDNKAKQFAKELYDELRAKFENKEFYSLMSHLEQCISKFDKTCYERFWNLLKTIEPSQLVTDLVNSEKSNGIAFYKAIFQNSNRKTMLCVPLTSLTRLVQVWQWLYPSETFSILHDETNELSAVESDWTARCTNGALDLAALHEAGLSGPLQVEQATSSLKVDSNSCVQIQLSDIVAGAAADYLNARLEPNLFDWKSYHNDLFEAGLFLFNAGGVLPIEPFDYMNCRS